MKQQKSQASHQDYIDPNLPVKLHVKVFKQEYDTMISMKNADNILEGKPTKLKDLNVRSFSRNFLPRDSSFKKSEEPSIEIRNPIEVKEKLRIIEKNSSCDSRPGSVISAKVPKYRRDALALAKAVTKNLDISEDNPI